MMILTWKKTVTTMIWRRKAAVFTLEMKLKYTGSTLKADWENLDETNVDIMH